MSDDAAQDHQTRVAALLEDNIRTELQAQNAMADLGLPQVAIARLASGIAVEVLHAFAVDWSPDWVKPGQAHAWEERGDFFARCPACLLDSPPADNREAAATWVATHLATRHPAQVHVEEACVKQPVRASASWVRDGTPLDAVSALVAYARTHNGRPTVNESQVTIRFGSRLAFRLMGLWTRRVPYAVRVSVAASDSGLAELTAEGYSDEGWYLLRTQSATLTFEKRIAETLDELRQQ